jgi:hypothetical protein
MSQKVLQVNFTFAGSRSGNDRHTVVVYPNANHALRDVETGEAAPLWDDDLAHGKPRSCSTAMSLVSAFPREP